MLNNPNFKNSGILVNGFLNQSPEEQNENSKKLMSALEKVFLMQIK